MGEVWAKELGVAQDHPIPKGSGFFDSDPDGSLNPRTVVFKGRNAGRSHSRLPDKQLA